MNDLLAKPAAARSFPVFPGDVEDGVAEATKDKARSRLDPFVAAKPVAQHLLELVAEHDSKQEVSG